MIRILYRKYLKNLSEEDYNELIRKNSIHPQAIRKPHQLRHGVRGQPFGLSKVYWHIQGD
jgi:hypothetical protein